jgi:CDP-2,3-bis-(O-geranylgeranyl)-sn-glycerol synthase
MTLFLTKTFFFLAPAGMANMLPHSAFKLSGRHTTPIDFGKTLGGKPIFGSHKTWRGLILGSLGGTLTALLEALIFRSLKTNLSFIPLSFNFETAFFGFLLGTGALLGDCIKSFFKRRVNIAPGQSWVPFDQVDWILGALLFTLPFYPLPSLLFPSALTMGLLLHLLIRFTGFLLKINREPI